MDKVKNNASPFFVCYSLPLMLFLREHGIRYDVEAKHKITDNPLWVYLKTPQLRELLTTWNHVKK